MSVIKRAIKDLTKEEFDQAYKEMSDKFIAEGRRHQIPDKQGMLNFLLQIGEITIEQLIKFNQNETTSESK